MAKLPKLQHCPFKQVTKNHRQLLVITRMISYITLLNGQLLATFGTVWHLVFVWGKARYFSLGFTEEIDKSSSSDSSQNMGLQEPRTGTVFIFKSFLQNSILHKLRSRGSRFLSYNFLQFAIDGKNNSKTKVEKAFFFIFISSIF
jgi:hypothetical protein